MEKIWEVRALKYADRNARTRADSFIVDDDHDSPHAMDYFVWVLQSEGRVIVVDTGYEDNEAARRQRPIIRDPAEALAAVGVRAEDVDTVIITHLHYDHAGGLDRFPNAKFHLQKSEMEFATGPCMCDLDAQAPFSVEHVCEMVRKVYSGRVIFYDGDGEVEGGVTVHSIGGHSRGLQAVRVKTSAGYLCLASDAAHYYENFILKKPFPIVHDLQQMVAGFRAIEALASERSLVIPGHDPLVTELFPTDGSSDFVWRLDQGPSKGIPQIC